MTEVPQRRESARTVSYEQIPEELRLSVTEARTEDSKDCVSWHSTGHSDQSPTRADIHVKFYLHASGLSTEFFCLFVCLGFCLFGGFLFLFFVFVWYS